MEHLQQIVRQHRRMSGLTQTELAKLAGVGKTVVFDLEHGKESIRLDTLMKILTVLNISMHFESPLMAGLQAQGVIPKQSSQTSVDQRLEANPRGKKAGI